MSCFFEITGIPVTKVPLMSSDIAGKPGWPNLLCQSSIGEMVGMLSSKSTQIKEGISPTTTSNV
jgi:hypothetical protein